MQIKINSLKNVTQVILECILCIGAYLLWIESVSFVTFTFMGICCIISAIFSTRKLVLLYKKEPALIWVLFLISLIPNVVFSEDFSKSLSFAKVLVAMICITVVFRQSKCGSKNFGIVVAVMSTLLSLSVIWEFIHYESFKNAAQALFSRELYLEISSLKGTFNRYVGFGVYSGPAACLIIYGICSGLSYQKKGLFFYIIIGIDVVAIILTGSRTLLCMLVLIWLLYSLYMKSRDERQMNARKFILYFIIAIAGSIVLYYTVFQNTEKLRLVDGSAGMNSILARLDLYKLAIKIFLQNPLMGTGINTYLNYSTINTSVESTYAHNLILQSFAEQGIIGTILLIGAIVYSYVYCIKKWKLHKDSNGLKFSILIQTVFLVYLMVGNPFYDINLRLIYFLAVAIGLRECMIKQQNRMDYKNHGL